MVAVIRNGTARSIDPAFATSAELSEDAKRASARLRAAKARYRDRASGRELRAELLRKRAEHLVF